MTRSPALAVRGLRKRYPGADRDVLADLNLHVHAGETVALLGRSGAGKSTLARCIVGLEKGDAGEIVVDGTRYEPRPRHRRREVQYVWQDAVRALSPYLTAAQAIREPLDAFAIGHARERPDHVRRLLRSVELDSHVEDRRPHQLSGGQCQRLVLARALASNPSVLVLDEPLSALDGPRQVEMMALLAQLAAVAGRATLLISHDLTAVRTLATRVALLDEGRIIEEQSADAFFAAPRSEAGQALLAAWPALPFDTL